VNLLIVQQNDYMRDIELRTKHIETLEQNIQRMHSRLKSEEQARLVSDSMSETYNEKMSTIR
jgi:KaiC/GvpD/RAD55 family RecA-like ATPase